MSYRSQARNNHPAMIHKVSMKTRSTVPGQMVISVFSTNLVSKWMRFSAPMLRDEASVKSLLCSSITRQMRYKRRNMGMDRRTSTDTTRATDALSSALITVHSKVKLPGIGWMAQMRISTNSWIMRRHEMAMRQSSTQLSTANSCKGMQLRVSGMLNLQLCKNGLHLNINTAAPEVSTGMLAVAFHGHEAQL